MRIVAETVLTPVLVSLLQGVEARVGNRDRQGLFALHRELRLHFLETSLEEGLGLLVRGVAVSLHVLTRVQVHVTVGLGQKYVSCKPLPTDLAGSLVE